MPYYSNGQLKTDIREVAIDTTWDSQTDWEAYQSAHNVDITNGVVSLAEFTIPDQEDLHAHYDATQLSLSEGGEVTSWPDETDNGHDLTQGGTPTYNASSINGNPTVSFDGVDDYLAAAFGTLPQPNSYFIVYQLNVVSGDFTGIVDGESSRQKFGHNNDNLRDMFAGANPLGTTENTDAHIASALFNGVDSSTHIDGALDIDGDAGTADMVGITLGAEQGPQRFADVDIGEVLVYPQDKSGIRADVEQYLADKWGITI